MADKDNKAFDFPIGTIIGFHGLAGEVKIRPNTNNPELLLDMKTVRLVRQSDLNTLDLKVRSVRIDKKMLLIKFKDYNDRTSVEPFMGSEVLGHESELLPLEEEEFWVKDLVGMEVFTTEGTPVGVVKSIIYGGNDIIEIHRNGDPDDKNILVPFVKDLVPVVDLKAQKLQVVDIPGLLEPQ